ncbi:DNA-binding transcriptional regulator, XRE family [Actinopolyspora lacussalsi subsp. righensis]|uniref:DNA-binding transcriptional regulator, XRE family n=1 Tax=Actinopolyspora righensis TaxID=995060 RepID=A0A1I6X293_9ACTN|nr:helix-turn-helix transcriptional regulator [Actinopolyspora righensis]SFT32347.1 DNA-binding transcriptional regulator, XRE family [Actinopolyspora righensis]
MKWNLRLVAAHRGIWKAGELQHRLAEYGLTVSAGKMSGLWSGTPVSLKLSDLDIICAALDCEIGELLVPETAAVPVNELTRRGAATAHRDDQRTGT